MNLRWKIFGIIFLTFAGLVAILTFSLQGILVPHFHDEETRTAVANVQRVLGLIDDERAELTHSMVPWAKNDGLYAGMTAGSNQLLQPELAGSILASANIDTLAAINLQGEILSIYGGEGASLPAEVLARLEPGDDLLRAAKDNEAVSGLLVTSLGPMYLVSAPVLKSDGEGPAFGTLLALRTLDAVEVNHIAGVARFPLTLMPYLQADLPADFMEAKDGFASGETIVTLPASDTQLASFVILSDFYERPAYILRVEQGRSIYRNSQIVLMYLYLAMIMGALLFTIMTFLSFDRLVLARIRLLEREVAQIGAGGELSHRVTVVRDDELTRVSEAINGMLENLQALSHRLVAIQEAERRRIALELHDEIGQLLTGLKLQLDTAAKDGVAVNGKPLTRARELTDELIQKTRNLSLDLRPSMLDDLGLLPALIWHFDRFTELTGVQVDFSQNGLNDRRFGPEVESTAYRLIQEALTNTARYAGVQQVSVRATYMDSTLMVQVEDRGTGFEVNTALDNGRTRGLRGMQERVALLGGSLIIDSVPGWGTSILAELPAESLAEERMEDDHNNPGG